MDSTMKNWITTLALSACLASATGQRYVGGSFATGFERQTHAYRDNLHTTQAFFQLNPTIGRAAQSREKGWALRMEVDHHTSKDSSAGTPAGIYSRKSTAFTLGAGPFLRRKQRLFDRCDLFGEAALPVAATLERSSFSFLGNGSADLDPSVELRLDLKAGVLYQFLPQWRVEAQFGLARLGYAIDNFNAERVEQTLSFATQLNTPGWFRLGIVRFIQNTEKR